MVLGHDVALGAPAAIPVMVGDYIPPHKSPTKIATIGSEIAHKKARKSPQSTLPKEECEGTSSKTFRSQLCRERRGTPRIRTGDPPMRYTHRLLTGLILLKWVHAYFLSRLKRDS
jgi:hypothetical protein